MRNAVIVVMLSAASLQASVIYSFVGTGLAVDGYADQPVAFQLTLPNFIPQPGLGEGVSFTCSQLDSSTNCGPFLTSGVEFYNSQIANIQSDIAFDADDNVGYIFYFQTGAFDTPGVYNTYTQSVFNPGVLTVTQTPEPASILLALSGFLLYYTVVFMRIGQTRTSTAFGASPRYSGDSNEAEHHSGGKLNSIPG
jgi:hypothetical protein